jgi:chromosome segregation ATPase
MREKMEELEEMAAFKQEWTDLKREYEALARRNQITEEELADLKRSLEELTCAAGDESENLRQEIKYLKEERLLSDAHWEAIISDKEELIKKDARTSQEKEYSLCEKISQLEEQIETLEEELAEKNTEIEGRKDDYRCEITAKSEDLVGFEKILDSLKKQNSDLKTKIVSLQDSYAKEK